MARTLNRFVEDTQRRFSELNTTIGILVTRDLYEAHRAAILDDLRQLQAELKAERDGRQADQKAEREGRAADRRMVHGALVAAALSLIVTIVAAAFVVALGLKP
ncbi:hypothetical protein ACGF0J_22070 [Nonomuraea sp. NPDC047897]|uniref:hypothetical protein n=1 Tax=Nonomuraea sp. NPDC047897 TaxID=3364346 RepID=UPI00371488A9